MVHQYKNNGYNIVLDVNSGAIHVVDDVTYDVIALFEEHTTEEICAALRDRYPETEIKEAMDEVRQLKENEELFTEDIYEQKIIDFKKRPTVVKALCLHIAHDCNLACGPMPMLRAVKQYAEENNIEAWISLEERMACGIGACLACVCRSVEKDEHSQVNNKRICKEGPVFNAREVDI